MLTEDDFKSMGLPRSTNALTWGGFALLSFILVATILGTTSLPDKFFYQISAGAFLASAVLFGVSWSLYEHVGSNYEIISQRNNPREVITKQAELSVLGGTFLWIIGIIFLTLYLKIYLTLIIFLVVLVPLYIYGVLRYFVWRK